MIVIFQIKMVALILQYSVCTFPHTLLLLLLIISVGVVRRPSFKLASALRCCRVNWSKEMTSPAETTASLSAEAWREETVEIHVHTTSPCHTVFDPSTLSRGPFLPPLLLMLSEERSRIERELETVLVLSKELPALTSTWTFSAVLLGLDRE